MTPGFRKLILTTHIAFSVGWIGAVAAFLTLAIPGLTTHDLRIVSAAYVAMELIARLVIVPLALASLLSGLIQSLATPWGLFRHYWIVAKLALTMFATVVLLKKMPLIGYVARRTTETPLPSAAVRAAGIPLIVHAAGGIVVLLAITILSVYKPWGLTRYGQRKQQEQPYKYSKSPQPMGVLAKSNPDNRIIGNGRRSGLKIVLAAGFCFLVVAVHISMHLMGHSLHHGH